MNLFPDWMADLPLQQQAVLVLALRGPDGDQKDTRFKHLLRAYRGTVMRAAALGRFLTFSDGGDSFMSLRDFAIIGIWESRLDDYLKHESDAADLHQYTHFMHGAEILGYKHPDEDYRYRWSYCYGRLVENLHLVPELEYGMDNRLNDFGNDWNAKN